MAYTSEIEKLEKRWLENPKGRNFAPLADAYRKAGEVDRAIDLCKAGLERHPDYVSAHIVFARCLIDQKNDAGASDVFRKVLALDPENVLALKILAEIAERGGRFDEAAEWLGRLLAADPMNGDAAEGLTRARGKAAQAVAKQTPEPVVRLVPDPAPHSPPPPPPPPPPSPPTANRAAAPSPLQDLLIEHASEEPTSPALDVKGAPADIETFDGTLDFNAVAHSAAKADGIEVTEEVELKPQDLVVEGLAHSQYESGLFGTPPDTAPAEDEPIIDLPLIMPDDMGGALPPTPLASPDEAPPVVAEEAPAASGGASSAPPTPPPAAVVLSDDDGAADTAALSRVEPVLTETMAELYLRQGHQEDALRVYQALLTKRPADRRLRGRVEALTGGGNREETAGTGETVQVFLKRILGGRPGVPGPAPSSPPARSPLDDAFARAHSDVEPGPPEGVVSPGEATRPADDSISLDEVFGDEGPRHSGAAPGPAPAPAPAPARVPELRAVVPPAAAQQSGGFSFDQFFSGAELAAAEGGEAGGRGGGGGGGGAQGTPGEGATPPAGTSGAGLRPPLEDEGDLDQFQAWLKGLKS